MLVDRPPFRMSLLAALVLLAGGCGGEDLNQQASAQAQTELAKALPTLQEQVHAASTAGLLPPDASIGSDMPTGEAVPIAFFSTRDPAALLEWYRSGARRASFTLVNQLQEGAEHVIDGRSAAGKTFQVRLAPGNGGGTTGMLLMDL